MRDEVYVEMTHNSHVVIVLLCSDWAVCRFPFRPSSGVVFFFFVTG
jgi:hypothetical protein